MPGARSVEIEIGAKIEKLEAGLRAAENKIKSTMDRIGRTGGGAAGGAAGGLSFQGGELVGGLAKGVVTIGAIQAGVSVLRAGVAALKGDWSGLEQIVRGLPAGIGSIVGGVIDLSRELDGSAARAERMAKAAKEAAEQTARFRAYEKSSAGAGAGTRDVLVQTQLEAADPFEKIQVEREEALRKASEEFEQLRAKARETFKGRQYEGTLGLEMENIAGQEAERIAAIQAQFDARRDRETAKSAADLKERAQKSFDAEQESLKRLEDLRGQFAVMELQASGRTLDAQLQQIENSYRDRIAAAKGGERELLEQLMKEEKVRAISDDNARSRETQMAERRRTFEERERAAEQAQAIIDQRIGIIQGQRLSAEDAGYLTRGPTDRSGEIGDQQLRLQEETNRILREMAERDRRKEAFVVGFQGGA